MKYIDNYTEREWEVIASGLSGEKVSDEELLKKFRSEDTLNTQEKWENLNRMLSDKEINTEEAWGKVSFRIEEPTSTSEEDMANAFPRKKYLLRFAAGFLVLIGLGFSALYLAGIIPFNEKITYSTDNNNKNLHVTLPDGSHIYLNRNTTVSYLSHFRKTGREITLSGEAYFEIKHDSSKPFTVDAGTATIKVLGTSFNVITSNTDQNVEVFVKTGQVMLSDNSGDQNIIIDPGYIGIMDSEATGKKVNNNPNYLSWNTGLLIYDGQTLEVVFHDLKRVYDMDIIADDPSILQEKWTSPIDNQSQDTIIRLICVSFNLSYSKDGNVYHLSKK